VPRFETKVIDHDRAGYLSFEASIDSVRVANISMLREAVDSHVLESLLRGIKAAYEAGHVAGRDQCRQAIKDAIGIL